MAEAQDDFPPEAGESSRPAAKFTGSGGISAAVWKRRAESGTEHYSVRLERSFKNAQDQWESTPYLREGDLLRAAKLLEQVDEWIEQDRSRLRGAPQAAAGR